jgi:hypothetical protein
VVAGVDRVVVGVEEDLAVAGAVSGAGLAAGAASEVVVLVEAGECRTDKRPFLIFSERVGSITNKLMQIRHSEALSDSIAGRNNHG